MAKLDLDPEEAFAIMQFLSIIGGHPTDGSLPAGSIAGFAFDDESDDDRITWFCQPTKFRFHPDRGQPTIDTCEKCGDSVWKDTRAPANACVLCWNCVIEEISEKLGIVVMNAIEVKLDNGDTI